MVSDRSPQSAREWAELIADQFEVPNAVDALEEAYTRGSMKAAEPLVVGVRPEVLDRIDAALHHLQADGALDRGALALTLQEAKTYLAMSSKADDVRPEVGAFAVDMERKLRANDHKPGWKGDGLGPLTDRVLEEGRELERAVITLLRQVVWSDEPAYGSQRGNGWSRRKPGSDERQVGVGYREMEWPERGAQLQAIIDEAADVANMAMMVADEARASLTMESGDAG